MNKYTVAVDFLYSDVVEVYADTEDEALSLAFEESRPEYQHCIDSQVTDVEFDLEEDDND